MNGKEYLLEAIELMERLVSEIEESKLLDGDPLLEGTGKACEILGRVKNKATLRTKAGANLAFPVNDAAQKLDEAWEEAKESDDLDELKERMEEFVGVVEALGAALKERTVIMT
jgi:Zn-dependent M32 family carboxypeptidase